MRCQIGGISKSLFAFELADILSKARLKEKKTKLIINSFVKRLELETMDRGGGKCDLSGHRTGPNKMIRYFWYHVEF